jgi:hypothetical protein
VANIVAQLLKASTAAAVSDQPEHAGRRAPWPAATLAIGRTDLLAKHSVPTPVRRLAARLPRFNAKQQGSAGGWTRWHWPCPLLDGTSAKRLQPRQGLLKIRPDHGVADAAAADGGNNWCAASVRQDELDRTGRFFQCF